MAQNDAVARPYSMAVFDLARESGQLEAWSAVLANAAAAVEQDDVRRLFRAPGADLDRIAQMIAEVAERDPQASGLAGSEQGRNFFRLLAENRRLEALPAIAAGFEQLKAEVENTVDVVLTAATAVDDTQQGAMIEALKRRFGRDVRLKVVQDENMIGGAQLKADDHVIDGSIRTRLAKLASALVQ